MTGGPPLPFKARRDAILDRLEHGSLLLPAAPVRYKSGDSEYRYRPDSELFYATGWRAPECVAVLRGFADSDRFVLFVPERDEKLELWTGPRMDPGEVKASCGADAVFPMREFGERGRTLLRGGDTIHYRLGASAACDDVVAAALRDGRARRPRRGAGAHALVDPGAILDAMRLRKDAAEIARLRRSAQISVAAFREALPRVRGGVGEWEIEAALESGFRSRGADGPAFATIVAAGANACTLHYTANGSRIAARDMVLMDAGAEVDCYAADITRTVPASWPLDGARRDAYEVVRRAHRAAVAACAPGGTVAAVHEAASRVIAEGLVGLGVVDGPADEVLEAGTHRDFFPHQTSHWLGLDTHDAGAYRDAAGPVALEPGMVFTVEPGLYFAPGSCPRVPALEGTGIRLEDDVLVAEGGAEILTAGLPLELDAVADLCGAVS